MVLVFFVGVFFPLFLGYNFLPFRNYGGYCSGLFSSSEQELEYNWGYHGRKAGGRWLYDYEPAWFTLNLPQDFSTAREINKGRIPLWDPFSSGGLPTFETGQYRPFNPFKSVFYIHPTFWTYSAFIFLQLLAGAAGFYYWLRSERVSRLAATTAVAVFSFNPWMIDGLSLTDRAAFQMFPFVLLALRRAGPVSFRSVAVSALAFALMGEVSHPEAFLLLSFIGLSYYSFVISRGKFLRSLIFVFFIMLSTAVLLLPLWLPFARFFLRGTSYKQSGEVSFRCLYSWKSIFLPQGDLFLTAAVILTLLFAIFSKRRIVPLFLAALTISTAVLTNARLPWGTVGDMVHMGSGLMPAYLKCSFWFSLSVLFAVGLDQIGRDCLPMVKKTACYAAAFIFSLTSLFITYTSDVVAGKIHLSILYTGIIGMAVLIILSLLTIRTKALAFSLASIVLAVIVLSSAVRFSWNRAGFTTPDVCAYVSGSHPEKRTISLVSDPFAVLPMNWGQVFKIRQAEANTIVFPNDYFQLFHDKNTVPTMIYFDKLDPALFGRTGASLVLLPNRSRQRMTGRVFEGAWCSAYELEKAPGRLGFAQSQSADPSVIGGASESRADFLEDGETIIVISASSASGGLLVLRDNWFEGWKCLVDGMEKEILIVEGTFRGVSLEAGPHRVEFLYKPLLTIWCLWISGLYFVILALSSLRLKRTT